MLLIWVIQIRIHIKSLTKFSIVNEFLLGHSNKVFRFPSPEGPIFFGKVKKKNPESLVKKQVL